jgi:hypothetical protein
MNISRAALLALLLAAAAGAQTPAPAATPAPASQAAPETPQKRKADIDARRGKLQPIVDQERGAIKSLTAKQDAERKAVLDDKTLDNNQRKAKLEAIRVNYAKQRADAHKAAAKARRDAMPQPKSSTP